MIGLKYRAKAAFMLIFFTAVTACSATYLNHGYIPTDSELAELVVGVDSRATVDDVIGPPSTSGLLSGGDYYYVRSRVKQFGMFRPQEIERQVLAISFDESDAIANIERFGLEDGNVVPLSRRVTDSSVLGNGFIRQMIGNIGAFDPGQVFN